MNRRATRREVHATGLWHRAVHILVFDGTGRVLLQKRSMLKDLSPGLWDSSCSGHLDAGEDYDAAAIRELAEEIGAVIHEPRLLGVVENHFTYAGQPGHEIVFVFDAEFADQPL